MDLTRIYLLNKWLSILAGKEEKMSYEIMRKLMFDKRVTKADVIRATGVTRPVLTDWEKRGREPSLATLRRLAEYFGVPVVVFLKED